MISTLVDVTDDSAPASIVPLRDEVVRGVVGVALERLVRSAPLDEDRGEDEALSVWVPDDYGEAVHQLVQDQAGVQSVTAMLGRDALWIGWSRDSIETVAQKLAAVNEVVLGERRRLLALAQTAPAWSDLTDRERGQIVVFLRTAVDEGLGAAWENRRPTFAADSRLSAVKSGTDLRLLYGRAYEALDADAFWDLYEQGEPHLQLMSRPGGACPACGHAKRAAGGDQE